MAFLSHGFIWRYAFILKNFSFWWKNILSFYKHNSKATERCLAFICSHSSLEFFLPSTPEDMKTQELKKKKGLTIIISLGKSVLIWIDHALNFLNLLSFARLPKLFEAMQRKIWCTRNWQEGNILSLFSGLAMCRKIKSSIQVAS